MKHRTHNRILSFFLALVMLCTNAPFPVNSVENGEENASKQPSGSSQLVYDYDTLKITKDGTKISSLSLQSHEKIEISADGISANAEYQWQVQHPENDDVWVNVYDGTNQTISVTAALVGNVLREDGTAKLRCRAYTDDYAYLTNTLTVTLCSEVQSVGTVTGENKTLLAAADGDTDAETPEFVTITMQYRRYDYEKVWDDTEKAYVYRPSDTHVEAFSSYKAMIPYGKDFTATITLPTIVGYDAYYENDTTATKEVTLTFDNVIKDIVVHVYYKPADVDYTVRYYFQNIYDDQYVEDTSILGTLHTKGPTGSAPNKSAVYATVDGFTSLFYQPDTIAADGSTVFEVYYERNYYLMEFDCNGGFGTDTLYVRYGTYVSVSNPVKSGYTFDGWDLIRRTDESGNNVAIDDGSVINDEQPDVLPSTLPAYNSAYKAVWSQADTKYTVAYWIVNDDGTRSYLGCRIETATTGAEVDGIHDLGLDIGSGAICGELEHTHTAECVYVCGKEAHTHHSEHTIACYHAVTEDGGVDTKDMKAIDAANATDSSDPEDGAAYFYFIQADYDVSAGRYWPKMLIGTEHFTVTINGQSSIGLDVLNAIVDGGEIVRGTADGLTAIKYKAKADCGLSVCDADCDKSEHTHIKSCRSCDSNEHTHTDSCKKDAKYLDEVISVSVTDKNGETITYTTSRDVTIEGDGSSVVDVYYQYRQYTLKFYYAATVGGTDTDGDGINDSDFDSVKIVGGSTYYFGYQLGTNTAEDEPQLEKMFYNNSSECGEVTQLPSLNTTGAARNYTKGGLKVDRDGDDIIDVTYHYISFQARYGDDISGMWPCGVFESATRADTNNANGWHGTEAFVSAWNGEHHVAYSRNGNETIKGVYEKLDEALLFHSDYTDSNEVSYLCFWENGAPGVTWNIPELYIYNIWLPCIDNKQENAPTGKQTKQEDGIWYYLDSSYNTCDDSKISTQTTPSITGYNLRAKKWSAYFMTDARLYTDENYYYVVTKGGWEKVYQNGTVHNDTWNYQKEMKVKQLADAADGTARYIVYDTSYDPDNPGTVINHNLYREAYAVDFYYTASTHKLVFWNHSDYLTNGTGVSLVFGYPLAKYGAYTAVGTEYMKVRYPDSLEPGAYEFAGWYTTAECWNGTEMDWSKTMPDTDLTVYAKYVPINRDIYFFLTYDDMTAYLDDPDAVDSDQYFWETTNNKGETVTYPITVAHGKILGTAYYYQPTRIGDYNQDGQNDYTFVGWFYITDDGKKRFAPDSMEVKQDLYLFAEWKSEMDTTYKVSYVLKEAVTIDGTTYAAGTAIADVTEGHSTAGKTKTFNAKGTYELKAAFQEGFFPEAGSHSILMDPVSTNNTYQFKYVYDKQVRYKVLYLDYATKLEIATSKEAFSSYAVHTERFLPIAGYVPMNGYYYVTKSLASDGDSDELQEENIFIFYYMKDTEHGAYSIEYYLQNLDGTYSRATYFTNTADLFVKDTDGNFVLDTEGNKIPNTIDSDEEFEILGYDGYTYVRAEVTKHNADGTEQTPVTITDTSAIVSGELDANGLTIKLYYERNKYQYRIEYRDISTEEVVKTVKTDYAMLDEIIKDTAVATVTTDAGIVYNYVTTGETEEEKLASMTKSITIRVPTPDDPATPDVDEGKDSNVLVFYYAQKQYTIHYVLVCTDSERTAFGALSLFSEIAPSAANLSGSTATAAVGYRFVGWYSDEACTIQLTEATTYKPVKIIPDANDECFYYALFEPITADLTINKSVSAEPTGANHSFIFTIVGKDSNNKHINLTISINGDGSVTIKDLPIGDYTITELSGWSYQYTADQAERNAEVSESNVNEISFTNTYQGSDWLGDEDSVDNDFGTYAP